MTQGVDVVALRKRAEAALLDVRCHYHNNTEVFAKIARELSNCPSGSSAGMLGGDPGWLTSNDCAPEFAKESFRHPEVGVLLRLVHSRFGLHVVEVLQREPGVEQPFEGTRHRDHAVAPENLCDCAAPVPAPTGSTAQRGRRGTGDNRHTVVQ